MAGSRERRFPGPAVRRGAVSAPPAAAEPLRRWSTPVPEVDDASGLPVDADAPQRRRPVVPLSEAVNRVLKHFGVDARVQDSALLDAMLRAWPEVAGPELASRLEPEKYDRNILYVLARNNAELFEIRQFKLRGLEARAKRHPAFAGLRQIRVRCR